MTTQTFKSLRTLPVISLTLAFVILQVAPVTESALSSPTTNVASTGQATHWRA